MDSFMIVIPPLPFLSGIGIGIGIGGTSQLITPNIPSPRKPYPISTPSQFPHVS